MLRTVAAVLIDHLAPFEFGVICEVFGLDRTDDGVPPIDFRVCGERPGKALHASIPGVMMTPQYGLDALEDADLIALPAASVRDDYPPAVIDALRHAHTRGATLLSVCSGAFLLGATGLLDGRHCTTHWRHVKEFEARYPEAKVDPDVLFVDEGDVVTSAGTAAGIDACLHLVRRELGSAVANAIARRMIVPPQRDGGQRQFIDLPVPETECDSLQPVLDWMLGNLNADFSTARLARRARMS